MSDLATPLSHESGVVAGRSCGTCTLCCKVIAVGALNKAPGSWCTHCKRDKGCTIYAERPSECRDFFCHWMVEKGLGPEWKPDRAKFALVPSRAGLTAFVDPGYAAAWRSAPYYETFKRWAHEGLSANPVRLISIRVGARAIVILPDRDVDLGPVGPQESIRLEKTSDGRLDVRKSGPAALPL